MPKCIVFESRTQDGGGLRRQEAEDVRMAKGLNGIPEVGYLRNVVMKAIWRHQSG